MRFNVRRKRPKKQEVDDEEEISLPIIGELAPDFTAVTTDGEVSLEDYRGQWLMLFSHP